MKQCKEFVAKIAPLIQAEAKKRGYKVCSASIAQACVESAYGLSGLAKYHNYFGLKCGSKWKGKSVNMRTKEEYTPGTLTTIKDNFRAYDTMMEGVRGYYDFISTPRYNALFTADTPQDYLERIKAAGYATSSTYVGTCMNVVREMELEKWDLALDNLPPSTSGNPYPAAAETLRFGSRGLGVRWLQFELARRGYPLIVDGIFGETTTMAVKSYQQRNGLVVDGIVGVKTMGRLLDAI